MLLSQMSFCRAMGVRHSPLLFTLDIINSAGQCGGRLIGELPTLSNGVRGMFYAESETTFCIDQFYYDGLGPGKARTAQYNTFDRRCIFPLPSARCFTIFLLPR